MNVHGWVEIWRIGMLCSALTGLYARDAQGVQAVAPGAGRQVPPAMIGANTITRDQLSNIDPWSDPQSLSDLVETGMSLMRYPGGTYGNYFDWNEGRPYDTTIVTHRYPPEQTKTATDALDGKVLWMANVLMEPQADIVAAMSNAVAQGCEIKYIELGNEFYFNAYDPSSGSYDPSYLGNGWVDGTAYGNDMNGWIATLKATFPDAIISLPFDRGINNSTTTRRAQWNAKVAAACTNYDAITIHVYTDSLVDLGYGDSLSVSEQMEQWNYFTTNTNAIQLAMGAPRQGWSDMVNHPNFWIPPDKPIWFTEFGVQPDSEPEIFKGTWADGLVNFVFYHTLLSHPQAQIATEHQYIDLHHGGPNEFSAVKIDVGQNLSGTLGTLTAEGHVQRALNSVTRDKEIMSILQFGNAHMVSPPGIDPYPALVGMMFSDSASANAIIANISDQPQEIDTSLLGSPGAAVTLMTANHFYTFVVTSNDVHYTNFTMGATIALPPFTLCTLTGLDLSLATGGEKYTPKFSGARIPVFASDDMAYTRPVAWDAADQNAGDTHTYSLVGTNPAWVSAVGTGGLQFAASSIGTYEAHVRVVDGSGLTDYATFDINVIDGSANSDGDAYTNNEEILLGTNPTLADTDGDGYSDSDDAFPLDPARHAPESGPVPTNYWAVVHGWYYDGLTNGAGMAEAISTGTVGGIAFANDGLPSISNNAVHWEYDGIDASTFSTLSPAGYVGATSGVFQIAWTYVSADFANTDAANANANVGFGIRSTANGNEDARFRLRYDGVANQFLLQLTDADANDATIATFPGHTLSNLTVRMVLDMGNRGTAGSLKFYYTANGGSEVAGSLSGRLSNSFQLDLLRYAVQSTNGTGNNWQQGDVVVTDDLVFSKLTQTYVHKLLYSQWLADYPALGSSTNLTDNPDGDVANNLVEYAIGGDPANGMDAGHWPVGRILEAGGTSYLEYVYVQRSDADARGLTYALEWATNLVSGSWSNAGYMEAGVADLLGGFEAVTNLIPLIDRESQFIRLRIAYP